MRTSAIALLLLAGLVAEGPARAEPPAAPPSEAGRFSFSPIEGGLMRLDTRTGAVSICARAATEWACRAVPDDRAALESEIGRLAAQNTALAAKVAELERRLEDRRSEPPPSPPAAIPRPDVPPPRADGPMTRDLPTDADIDRAMSVMEKLLRRLQAMIEGLRTATPPPPTPPGKI